MDMRTSVAAKKNTIKECPFLPGRILAAPSWVIPGTLAENCVFLATRVDEVGLLFMESQSCLAYEEADLPSWLSDLPLRYHVHLPQDLPMHEPARAAAICHALLQKVDYLAGNGSSARVKKSKGITAVLHPPSHDPAERTKAARLLENFLHHFTRLGQRPERLLVENIAGNDLLHLQGVLREASMGVCMDLGHALAYGQYALLRSSFFLESTGMLHLSAPGKGEAAGAHLPLAALDAEGHEAAARLCASVPPHATIMLELFSWQQIKDSFPFLLSWLRDCPERRDVPDA